MPRLKVKTELTAVPFATARSLMNTASLVTCGPHRQAVH